MKLKLLAPLVVAASLFFGHAARAFACPFCGEANATDQARSDAYELSILFMLAMPALVFSGFAFAFYRLNKSAAAANAAAQAAAENVAPKVAHSVSDANPVGSR